MRLAVAAFMIVMGIAMAAIWTKDILFNDESTISRLVQGP